MLATSPTAIQASFGSPPALNGFSSSDAARSRTSSSAKFPQQGKALAPFPVVDAPVKILLLENVNTAAVELLRQQGYHVEEIKKALGEDELIQKLRDGQFQAVGIRSKTKITAKVIKECPQVSLQTAMYEPARTAPDSCPCLAQLLVIGCFCIGTNQVDLLAASKAGIPVFNSPFSNSRSVAELVISEVVALARQLCDRSREMREGVWNKVSKGCWEIRGKTLGVSRDPEGPVSLRTLTIRCL